MTLPGSAQARRCTTFANALLMLWERQNSGKSSHNVTNAGNPPHVKNMAVVLLWEQETSEAKMTNEQIKYMVDRFLQWKLPENWKPDGGISFEKFGKEV